MNRLLSVLALPSASAYIFFSGIFTSLATNLFTGDRRTSTQLYDLIGLGTFADFTVHLSRVLFTLLIGASLFWLGYIREEASRKADFVRGDETSEEEYSGLLKSAFRQKTRQAVLAFLLLLGSSVVVINTSFVL